MIRRLPAAVVLAVLVLVACARSVETSRATLDVLELDGGLSGFVCRESRTQAYLTERATRVGLVAFVVDFIALGGQPKCDSDTLQEWCGTPGRCRVVARTCFERELASGAASSNRAVADAYSELRGKALGIAAPSEPVLVRLTATTETCEELNARPAAPFGCAGLVGCAISCPVLLDGLNASVAINLDMGRGFIGDVAYESVCSVGVEMCAMIPNAVLAGDCDTAVDVGPGGPVRPDR